MGTVVTFPGRFQSLTVYARACGRARGGLKNRGGGGGVSGGVEVGGARGGGTEFFFFMNGAPHLSLAHAAASVCVCVAVRACARALAALLPG